MQSLDPPGRLTGRECAERSDAARNRQRLLATAREIVDRHGVDGLTMDGLAAEAGLGKGTIFRRFGSRAGLLHELLDDTETRFQQAFLSGPPPLGPGAAPVERLVALGRARIALLGVQGELLRSVEASSELRYSGPARAAAALHIQVLLRQAEVAGDREVLTFSLMATLDATLVLHQTRTQEISPERVADGWERLVRAVTRADEA